MKGCSQPLLANSAICECLNRSDIPRIAGIAYALVGRADSRLGRFAKSIYICYFDFQKKKNIYIYIYSLPSIF